MIGLRLANNTFFPVLQEGRSQKKRLVLTTVRDNQPTVQIDLYRGDAKDIGGDQYIATLSVEDIRPGRAGEPDVELVMDADETGNLNARAVDRAGESENTLSVSLQRLAESETNEVPNFALEDDYSTPGELGDYSWDATGESGPADEELGSEDFGPTEEFDGAGDRPGEESFAETDEGPGVSRSDERDRRVTRSYADDETEKRGIGPAVGILLLVIGIVIIGFLVYLIFRPVKNEPLAVTQPASAQTATPQTSAPSGAAKSSPTSATARPTTPAPASAKAPAGATSSTPGQHPVTQSQTSTAKPTSSGETTTESGPAPAPDGTQTPNGVWYRISRGDTLWDLAYSFYSNPWLYNRIATENNIPNPDKIYRGDRLFIPLDKSQQTGSTR